MSINDQHLIANYCKSLSTSKFHKLIRSILESSVEDDILSMIGKALS